MICHRSSASANNVGSIGSRTAKKKVGGKPVKKLTKEKKVPKSAVDLDKELDGYMNPAAPPAEAPQGDVEMAT